MAAGRSPLAQASRTCISKVSGQTAGTPLVTTVETHRMRRDLAGLCQCVGGGHRPCKSRLAQVWWHHCTEGVRSTTPYAMPAAVNSESCLRMPQTRVDKRAGLLPIATHHLCGVARRPLLRGRPCLPIAAPIVTTATACALCAVLYQLRVAGRAAGA